MGLNELLWESRTSRGKTFDEADITDFIGDDVIDSVCGIDVTIRKYATVYTIAAIIDLNGDPGGFDGDSDRIIPLGTDTFLKLASYRHRELSTAFEFAEAIKNANRKLKDWVNLYGE